jgi:modulator of FtsH protease
MNSINSGTYEFSSDAQQAAGVARLSYVRKVYSYFGLGLLTAVAGTLITMGSVGLMVTISQNILIAIILYFGAFIFASKASNNPTMALPAMLLFTFISGAILAPTLFIIAATNIDGTGPGVIYNALFCTCLIFAALTTYVFVTKKDFSYMGASLVIGLFLIIGASIVNIFVQSSTLDLALAVIGVILFSGFILYKTSNILRNPFEVPPTLAALGLYISFLNLFLSLLRILGGGRRD